MSSERFVNLPAVSGTNSSLEPLCNVSCENTAIIKKQKQITKFESRKLNTRHVVREPQEALEILWVTTLENSKQKQKQYQCSIKMCSTPGYSQLVRLLA